MEIGKENLSLQRTPRTPMQAQKRPLQDGGTKKGAPSRTTVSATPRPTGRRSATSSPPLEKRRTGASSPPLDRSGKQSGGIGALPLVPETIEQKERAYFEIPMWDNTDLKEGDLRDMVKRLQCDLINAQEDVEQYKAEYERIQEEGRQLYGAYVAKCNRLKDVASSYSTSQKQHAILAKECEDLRQKCDSQVAKVEEWKAKCKQQADRFKENFQSYKALKAEYKALKEGNEHRKRTIAPSGQASSKIAEELREYAAKEVALKEELLRLSAIIDEQKAAIAISSEEVESAQQALFDSEEAKMHLEIKQQEQLCTIQELSEELKHLKAEVENVKPMAESFSPEKIAHCATPLDQRMRDVTMSDERDVTPFSYRLSEAEASELDELRGDKARLEEALATSKSESEMFQAQILSLQAELKSSEERERVLKDDVTKALTDGQSDAVKSHLESIAIRNDVLRDENQQLQKKLNESVQQRKDELQQKQQMEEILASEKQNLLIALRMSEEAQKDVEHQLQTMQEDLEKSIYDKVTELTNRNQEEKSAWAEENAFLKSQCQELSMKLNETCQKLQKSQKSLRDAEERESTLSASIETLQKKHDHLQTDLCLVYKRHKEELKTLNEEYKREEYIDRYETAIQERDVAENKLANLLEMADAIAEMTTHYHTMEAMLSESTKMLEDREARVTEMEASQKLTEEIQKINEEKNVLQQDLTEAHAELMQQRQLHQRTMQQCVGLEKQVEALETVESRLCDFVSTVQLREAELAECRAVLSLQEEKIHALEKQTRQQAHKIGALETGAAAFKAASVKAEMALITQETVNNAMASSQQRQIEILQQEMAEAADVKEFMEEEAELMQEQMEELECDLTQTRGELHVTQETLKREIIAREAAIIGGSRLCGIIAAMQGEIAGLRSSLAEEKMQSQEEGELREELRVRLEQSEKRVKHLKARNNENVYRIQELFQTLEALGEQYTRKMMEKAAAMKEMVSVNSSITWNQQKLGQRCESCVSRTDNRICDAYPRTDAQDYLLSEAEDMLQSLQAQVSSLRNTVRQKIDAEQLAQKDLKEAQAIAEEQTTLCMERSRELEAANNDIYQLRVALGEATEKCGMIEKWELMWSEQTNQTEEMSLRLERAQDAVEELEEELRTRVLQISLVENERDQLMIQMEILLHMVDERQDSRTVERLLCDMLALERKCTELELRNEESKREANRVNSEMAKLKHVVKRYRSKSENKIQSLKLNLLKAENEVESLDELVKHLGNALLQHREVLCGIPDLSVLIETLVTNQSMTA